jgi:PucR C-terminal helix-turn-helix domain/GGDEF-like domain
MVRCMTSDQQTELPPQQVTDVAKAVYGRTDEVSILIARAITREVPLYGSTVAVPFDAVVQACAANLRAIFGAIAAGDGFDLTAATRLGADRAREGVPLSSVMEAYRVGFRRVWEALADESDDARALRVLTDKLLAAQDVLTAAMAAGYREEQTSRARCDEMERSVLIDALLHGRLFQRCSLWEAADYLRMPSGGPFVVITADTTRPGADAMPDVEPKLRSLDVASAWRQLPDVQVGIVHVKTDHHVDATLTLVAQLATGRIGVSARFGDLRDTPRALLQARVTLRGRPEPGTQVSVFDGSILATAAVSAPEVMVELARPVIDCFADLADEERDVLFETFRVWVDQGGSVRTTAELLFCHPNTVRYRMHRIEQRTGRILGRPRDVAELCLAFEVHRRLMS